MSNPFSRWFNDNPNLHYQSYLDTSPGGMNSPYLGSETIRMSPMNQYGPASPPILPRCAWCGGDRPGAPGSCPNCGAPAVSARTTNRDTVEVLDTMLRLSNPEVMRR